MRSYALRVQCTQHMSDAQNTVVSQEKFDEMIKELEHLKTVRRTEIAKNLEYARSLGDLSENADYHKAKEDQAFLEGRIQEIEAALRTAVIIEKNQGDVVNVGTHVTIQEDNLDPEIFYVVGAKEADPRNGRISNESPIGSALMNHKVGDLVEADTPGGKIKFKILKIE